MEEGWVAGSIQALLKQETTVTVPSPPAVNHWQVTHFCPMIHETIHWGAIGESFCFSKERAMEKDPLSLLSLTMLVFGYEAENCSSHLAISLKMKGKVERIQVFDNILESWTHAIQKTA